MPLTLGNIVSDFLRSQEDDTRKLYKAWIIILLSAIMEENL